MIFIGNTKFALLTLLFLQLNASDKLSQSVRSDHNIIDEPITVQIAISGNKGKISGYKADFKELKSKLKNQKSTEDMQKRLEKDDFYLRKAIGEKSQVRATGADLLRKLAINNDLLRSFSEENWRTLDAVFFAIENYKYRDSVYDDFVMVENNEAKSEKMTASGFDKYLVLQIADLDKAIRQAEEKLNASDMASSRRIRVSADSKNSGETSQQLTNKLPTYTAAPKQGDLIISRIKEIVSWGDDVRIEKIAALQLLAAYDLSRLHSSKPGQSYGTQGDSTPTTKYLDSIRIFKTLNELSATLPSIHEGTKKDEQEKTVVTKSYKIEGLGYVSENQLTDYEKMGKGDLIRGLCAAVSKLRTEKIEKEKKYEQALLYSKYNLRNEKIAAKKKEREIEAKKAVIEINKLYKLSFSICANMQEKRKTLDVINELNEIDEYIEKLEKSDLINTAVLNNAFDSTTNTHTGNDITSIPIIEVTDPNGVKNLITDTVPGAKSQGNGSVSNASSLATDNADQLLSSKISSTNSASDSQKEKDSGFQLIDTSKYSSAVDTPNPKSKDNKDDGTGVGTIKLDLLSEIEGEPELKHNFQDLLESKQKFKREEEAKRYVPDFKDVEIETYGDDYAAQDQDLIKVKKPAPSTRYVPVFKDVEIGKYRNYYAAQDEGQIKVKKPAPSIQSNGYLARFWRWLGY